MIATRKANAEMDACNEDMLTRMPGGGRRIGSGREPVVGVGLGSRRRWCPLKIRQNGLWFPLQSPTRHRAPACA